MLGVVVPFWNPFADAARAGHLERCLAALRATAGVRVLCVEMRCQSVSGLADAVLTGGPESRYIWQKERLVNHGCALLAEEGIDYLGYVDADCLFVDPGWAGNVVRQFERGHNVVQGFSRAVDEVNSVPAALAAFPRLGRRLHGGSMFLHRELFLQVNGLYEHCIVGGGDFFLLMAVTGDLTTMDWLFPGDRYRDHAVRWLDSFRGNDIRPACADNAINILIHGNPNRSRRLRHMLLRDFDPEADILQGDVLGLTEDGKRLLPRLRAYCAHREDRADIILMGGSRRS